MSLRPELDTLLAEAAADMPWPTRGRDISYDAADYRVDFDFVTDGVGLRRSEIPHVSDTTRVCRTTGVWSSHPCQPLGTLADKVAKIAAEHRDLLEAEIERGHTDA